MRTRECENCLKPLTGSPRKKTCSRKCWAAVFRARQRIQHLSSPKPKPQPSEGNPELTAKLKTLSFEELLAYCENVLRQEIEGPV